MYVVLSLDTCEEHPTLSAIKSNMTLKVEDRMFIFSLLLYIMINHVKSVFQQSDINGTQMQV